MLQSDVAISGGGIPALIIIMVLYELDELEDRVVSLEKRERDGIFWVGGHFIGNIVSIIKYHIM